MQYFKKYEDFSLPSIFGLSSKDKISIDNEVIKTMKPIKIGDQGDNVKNLQMALEELGFKLTRFGVDAKFGWETLGQTKSLLFTIKENNKLRNLIDSSINLEIVNNIVTPEIQYVIIKLSQNEKAKNGISKHFQNIEKKIGSTELIAKDLIMKNIENPEAFIAKLYEICKKLQINPNWLLLVMWKESRIRPWIQNSIGATGLIQFMPSTARNLGTSIDELKKMTGVEQLDYVYKYYEPYGGKIKSVEDLYMITFFPVALGKSDDTVLQTKKLPAETIAAQNPAVNINKDDKITVGEFKDYVKKDIPNDWKDDVSQQKAA